jgi:FKBP-type peptidyl-prolyl cis-trans isomerase 2
MLKIGDTVSVHYTGKHLDGKIFDSTAAREPIIFTIGDDQMIPGFEKAVMSMHVNEKRTVTIPAKDAYGEYDEDLLIEVNRKDVFGDKEIKIGDTVQAPTDEGVMVFKVHKIDGDKVIMDGNFELAGKDLIFEIELLDVREGDGMNTPGAFDLGDELGDFDDEFGEEGIDFDDSIDINTL